MRLAASPITAEAVAERHSLDVRAAVGMGPARGIRGAAVKTRHALQEAFTPEERERGRGAVSRGMMNGDICV